MRGIGVAVITSTSGGALVAISPRAASRRSGAARRSPPARAWNAVASSRSACVPTTIWAAPRSQQARGVLALALGEAAGDQLDVAPVPAEQRAQRRACCSARISVGAIERCLIPVLAPRRARRRAPRRSSRCPRRPAAAGSSAPASACPRRSASTARRCAPVSGHGSVGDDPVQRFGGAEGDAGSTFTPRRRRARPSWTRNSSSKARRRRGSPEGTPRASSAANRSGKCDSRRASGSRRRRRRRRSESGNASPTKRTYSSTARFSMRRKVRGGTPSTSV